MDSSQVTGLPTSPRRPVGKSGGNLMHNGIPQCSSAATVGMAVASTRNVAVLLDAA